VYNLLKYTSFIKNSVQYHSNIHRISSSYNTISRNQFANYEVTSSILDRIVSQNVCVTSHVAVGSGDGSSAGSWAELSKESIGIQVHPWLFTA